MYGAVDILVVGRFGTTAGISGVSTGSSIVNLITGLTMGVTVVMGEKKPEKVGQVVGGGIFFIIAYNVISSISRGIGDSSMPLIFVGIACVVNIAGDLLFIAVFHWNVAGATLATVMAQAVSVILSILIIRKRKPPFAMKKEYIPFNPEIKRFIRVGTPIAFQEILTQLSFLALSRLSTDLDWTPRPVTVWQIKLSVL